MWSYIWECSFTFIVLFFFSTDNVTLQIDGVLYLRILDPFKVCRQQLEQLKIL